jgi:hypothetical protein
VESRRSSSGIGQRRKRSDRLLRLAAGDGAGVTPVTVGEVAAPGEKRRFKVLAIKVGAYTLLCLPITMPLAFLCWLGDKCDDALRTLDRPRYRWDSEKDDIWRRWIRAARRIREARPEAPK